MKKMTSRHWPRWIKSFERLKRPETSFSRRKTLKSWEIVLTSSKRRDRKFSMDRQSNLSNCSRVSTSVSTLVKSQTMIMASLKWVWTISTLIAGFDSYPHMTASNTNLKCFSTKLTLLNCRRRSVAI